jgi:hypothetical protein
VVRLVARSARGAEQDQVGAVQLDGDRAVPGFPGGQDRVPVIEDSHPTDSTAGTGPFVKPSTRERTVYRAEGRYPSRFVARRIKRGG